MYRVMKVEVRNRYKTAELYHKFKEWCTAYTSLKNTANFHIRQHMTGLKKAEEDRYPNEQESIDLFQKYIPVMTEHSHARYETKVRNVMNDSVLTESEKQEKTAGIPWPNDYAFPTAEKWFLPYNVIDGVLKLSKNDAYLSIPSQMNTNAIKDVCSSWNSWFALLRTDGLSGRPKPPKYIKNPSAITFTNQICRIIPADDKHCARIRFPKVKQTLDLGGYLPETAVLKQVIVKPVADYFRVHVIVECQSYEMSFRGPERISGIDIGGECIATITNNIGLPPVLVSGRRIREMNRKALSAIATAKSVLRKGLEPEDYRNPYSSKKTKRLYALRDKKLDDFFHKLSLFIVRYCKANRIDTIVIGRNKGIKQGFQNGDFNYIPFTKLYNILKYLCIPFGINYKETEESYTSQASFFMRDEIPVYGEEDAEGTVFSGTRTDRDTYVDSDGFRLHADVNGSLNIMRKKYPSLCGNIKRDDVVHCITMEYKDFYPTAVA